MHWHARFIPSWKYRFSSDQRSQAALGRVSTGVGDQPGTLCDLAFFSVSQDTFFFVRSSMKMMKYRYYCGPHEIIEFPREFSNSVTVPIPVLVSQLPVLQMRRILESRVQTCVGRPYSRFSALNITSNSGLGPLMSGIRFIFSKRS